MYKGAITSLLLSFFSSFLLLLQNADLKKQLHERQATITALSEKQVGN
jgi:hypothetical protein